MLTDQPICSVEFTWEQLNKNCLGTSSISCVGDFTFNSLNLSDAYMRRESYHHWFRYWLVAWSVPSHYLNQCWNIVNWTLSNKFQWNCYRNSNIFSQENAFENVLWKMAAIMPRPQCVKTATPYPSGQWVKDEQHAFQCFIFAKYACTLNFHRHSLDNSTRS